MYIYIWFLIWSRARKISRKQLCDDFAIVNNTFLSILLKYITFE